MASNEIEFHNIWIERCKATEEIRDQFGLHRALDYLIGEKLFSFVAAAEQHPEFAAELPHFVDEIRKIFIVQQVCRYLDDWEQTKFLPSPEAGYRAGIATSGVDDDKFVRHTFELRDEASHGNEPYAGVDLRLQY
jgi:hypothetical protein